ncbi:hypothetical protein CWK15_01695 [Salmonella enterica]|uniref:Uncharacterized protein n=1 Tax=Salmonella enterica TaxID=28901 RepID=A0A5V3YMA7_SALER|nr:hypothetical protein [Salmonella enterica]ECJ5902022.1 hypothetical protein [Salmonella enterica subsp. diarizonae]EDV1591268.1 hypothetical protein [Salmonella enterica subsp. salamae]EEE1788492.1 hypothetical protein [Salmonella enterica subsp. diarizonae serovar 61:l,v:1,5,7]EBU1223221.1 hypothetical protein [Salmonella enterica]
MALSRAQHEANKANGAYHIDRHGNRVPPALARSARSTDIVTGVRHTAANSAIDKAVFNDPLKLQIMSLRACGRHADAVASVTIIAKQFCRQSLRSLSLKLPACRLLVQPSGYES